MIYIDECREDSFEKQIIVLKFKGYLIDVPFQYYYINFLKNASTQDSDGLNGSYSVEKVSGQLQIHVQATTSNGNPIEYIYDIVSVGAENLILSYTLSGKTTQLYYTSKR